MLEFCSAPTAILQEMQFSQLQNMENWMRLSERSEDPTHHQHEIWIFPSECTKRKLFAETFVGTCNKKGNLSCQKRCTSVIKVTQRDTRKNSSRLKETSPISQRLQLLGVLISCSLEHYKWDSNSCHCFMPNWWQSNELLISHAACNYSP